jgi:hypothetical protein
MQTIQLEGRVPKTTKQIAVVPPAHFQAILPPCLREYLAGSPEGVN